MKNTIQNAYNSLSKSSFLRFTVFSKITLEMQDFLVEIGAFLEMRNHGKTFKKSL